MSSERTTGQAGEFELIERYFAPLAAKTEGAFGLHNDAAVLPLVAGERLVATVDTMIKGRHFLDCPPDLVARKLLRVNLSDLAAMGARPFGYLLASAWPLDVEESWIAAFAEGLAADQAIYGVALYGGDTTATPGPMTLSLTAFGRLGGAAALDRGSVRPGDDFYVTGTIGDGYLGLRVLRGELEGLPAETQAALVARYRLPEPRLLAGQALLAEGIARSALDVSDGLAADLGHLLEASGVAAEIDLASVPMSAAAAQSLALGGDPPELLLTGGDDYELLFASDPSQRDAVAALSQRLGLPIARIGRARAGSGLSLRDAAGAEVVLGKPGWTHF
ncbi:MAG: thiamine-phosphate kinase [Kiloniellaceae bacterium]|nr:thiamine-phosphate kinase [Kiloniellaceae bacterium]